MSILIRGMEMPKSCFYCKFRLKVNPDEIFCCVTREVFEETFAGTIERRKSNCPLVEIPPHGALIDADVPVKCYYYDDNVEATVCCYETLANFLGEDCPPTVIEAEGKE